VKDRSLEGGWAPPNWSQFFLLRREGTKTLNLEEWRRILRIRRGEEKIPQKGRMSTFYGMGIDIRSRPFSGGEIPSPEWPRRTGNESHKGEVIEIVLLPYLGLSAAIPLALSDSRHKKRRMYQRVVRPSERCPSFFLFWVKLRFPFDEDVPPEHSFFLRASRGIFPPWEGCFSLASRLSGTLRRARKTPAQISGPDTMSEQGKGKAGAAGTGPQVPGGATPFLRQTERGAGTAPLLCGERSSRRPTG